MSSRIEYIGVLAIVILAIITVLFFDYECTKAKRYAREMEIQIEMLKKQSEVEIQKAETAKSQAEAEVVAVQSQSERILQVEVPKECEKAIEWAITKAKEVRRA